MNRISIVCLPLALCGCLLIIGGWPSFGGTPPSATNPVTNGTARIILSSASPSESEPKMNVQKELFGKLPSGDEVDLYTLSNDKGMKA